jgi:hypothetical protein
VISGLILVIASGVQLKSVASRNCVHLPGTESRLFISLSVTLETILASATPLKLKKRERVRKDSIRVEVQRKHLGESERRFISEREKEHLVRRYPGNAHSSF